MSKDTCRFLIVILLSSLLTLEDPGHAQTPTNKRSQTKSEAKTEERKAKLSETNLREAQQREFAISLVMSLANEARSFRDLALRARVLARAANILWDVDTEVARTQFRRAWEAAEKADAEEVTSPQPKDGPPVMVIASGRTTGGDLRSEVLAVAARRDRALGEEFLAKLTEQTNLDAAARTRNASTRNNDESWSTSQAASKRLLVARRLLDDDQIERALEFAVPVLDEVNERTISFLSALRVKRAELADQRFLLLLAHSELDPYSDANTVSGLSSYAFTPGLYLTFSANGSVRISSAEQPFAPPDLPGVVRTKFFQVAATILLRPLLPPDQDGTLAGRVGRYMVIKRLLPLFDHYAPNTAVALRSQLTSLTAEQSESVVYDDDFLMTQGIQADVNLGNALERMQDQLDHANTSRERDAIYEDIAAALANLGDARARHIADKIDNAEHRTIVREFIDLALVQFAIRKNDASSIVRLAKAGALNHTQCAWAYAQAARLLMKSERRRALDLLEEALAEAQRIDADDPHRAHMLIGVATQLLTADKVRGWEITGEAVKAANAVEEFSGEDVGLRFILATTSGLKFIEISGADFSLTSLGRLLAREDPIRAIYLAKNFKNDAPRAVAILSIGAAVFEKSKPKPR